MRPTGIRQTHELGRLVKGLAGRIINGFAEQLVTAHTVHPHQLGVPAGDQQGHKRKFGRVGAQKGDSKCPSRWCTPITGLPSAAASEQATPAPTSSAPAKPGPRV